MDRDALAAQIISEFRGALQEMRCIGSQRLLRRGVSMAHLHVMALLERHGELGMGGIADVLDISLSNATGLIDRMEERGLVERVRVPDDRRVVRVRVTDAGRRALADLEFVRDELVARILARLDDRELARLRACVQDVKTAAAAVAADDPDLFAHAHDIPHQAAPAVPAAR